ncbi:hypothetical protein [Micromonospora sp. NPDC049891]|uniref:hypothetical protein n=1 Tax=Micromonospora sp. NPDC049891 TaxID=3155655 RepID=UPI0033FA26A8
MTANIRAGLTGTHAGTGAATARQAPLGSDTYAQESGATMNDRNIPTSPNVDPLNMRPTEEPPNLFDLFQQQPAAEQPATVAERFEAFVADNPRVPEEMIRLADEWIARTGSRKLGINALVEQVRWHVAMSTSDPDFKINNVFAPFLARLIAATRPDLADCFEYRRSVADEWIARRIDQDRRAA